ncbi:hypothetical protein A2U01_0101623 [Trifolium medium]|uniref:Uncharacterized protein n=1 Tax=Trifolium medium TaxID=97028 RepID=A0A392UYY8_9FABA|nr:hypothetical protein [Trifolium medium]
MSSGCKNGQKSTISQPCEQCPAPGSGGAALGADGSVKTCSPSSWLSWVQEMLRRAQEAGPERGLQLKWP